MAITLMNHQQACSRFWRQQPRSFNNSDPGTGKTIASIDAFAKTPGAKRMLVLAPLSILRPAWGSDIDKMDLGMRWAVAHGSPKKRQEAFTDPADVVIMNHDGVKWVTDHPELLGDFTHLVIDEYTAFKNPSSQRTKALNGVIKHFDPANISMLSGTPNSNTVLDLWAPAYMLDGGDRLGNSFWRFRSQVCTPKQVGPQAQHVQWLDRDDAVDIVTEALADITIRFTADECLDLPENRVTDYLIDLPPALMRQYRQLEQDAQLITQGGTIDALHAGAKVKKMLQLLSGAAYDATGNIVKVHDTRYELVIELAAQREQCVVAFNWTHERDALIRLAKKAKMSFGVIDGSVTGKMREKAVDDFQAGRTKLILCHPQSAGHGLTLTAGTTTIWCSPTYNAEHYVQLNARIHRKGQTQRTETIRIAARDTAELDVYEKLGAKLDSMQLMLELFAQYKDVA